MIQTKLKPFQATKNQNKKKNNSKPSQVQTLDFQA
jgi:hypothetical protein